jgi:hypothetical protein
MWRRRELLGMLGTSAAGLAIIAGRSEAAVTDDQPAEDESRHGAMLRECEEACGHCEATCHTAFHHCVTQAAAGKAEHAKMAQMVADCAAFCDLAAQMIARRSPLMVLSCRACAEACRHCAQECDSAAADAMMRTCATACRRCEEHCRRMVQAMGGEHRHESYEPAAKK